MATPRLPTSTTPLAPTVVPTEDQLANTYTDKELTEDEEAEWNDLWLEVSQLSAGQTAAYAPWAAAA